jgi:hypothetical protein
MDEGGRKQMKFILKDGLIHIVGNHGLPNNNIEGTVESKEIPGFSLSYSINGKNFVDFKDKIVVPKEALQQPTLQITVRASKGKELRYYKSDTIPLTHAIIFGKSLEDSYPEALKFLLKEINELREIMGLTKKELHNNMLELVDTFEEINKKGSLF